MVEWQQEVMITTSTPYLLGGCSNFDTKVLALCESNGEDLATLSIKNLLLVKILKLALIFCIKNSNF